MEITNIYYTSAFGPVEALFPNTWPSSRDLTDETLSVIALLPGAQTGSQEADRVGQAGAFAGETLVVGAKTGRGDGFQLGSHRFSVASGQTALIARFRLDAALYAPAPKRGPGKMGRPRKKG